MKKSIMLLALVLAGTIAFSQTTVVVSGTVTDQSGKPVPFAFIRDSQHPYATYSDSTGAFTFKADPSSQLIITAAGMSAIQGPITAPAKIVMAGNMPPPQAPFKNIFSIEASQVGKTDGGSVTAIGSGQQGTHGNRFFFDRWAHGFAVAPDNTITQKDEYRFNYNKIDGNIVFTTDGAAIHQVLKSEIKGFTLFDDAAQPYIFEDVPAIDAKHYIQVIASGPKYKFYKDLGTKFIKATFSTNGITSTGNNYDEFLDESVYYVAKMPDGAPQKLALKKKAIKAAFPADADKVNKYLTDNDGDINDAYLKGLADVLNQ